MTHAPDRPAPRAPLRVGVLLDSARPPRWVHALIASIDAPPVSTLALVVVHEARGRGARAGAGAAGSLRRRVAGLVRARRHWLYRLYRAADGALFPLRPDPFERASIEPLVSRCPLLRVASRLTERGALLAAETVDAILRHDLDVALQFGRRIGGRALRIARYGVWSCEVGAEPAGEGEGEGEGAERGTVAGFWEMMEGRPVTSAMLRLLLPEPQDDRVIALSFARTDKRSAKGNQFYCCQRGSVLVERKLHEVYERGSDALAMVPLPDPATLPPASPPRSVPTNAEMLVSMAKKGGSALRSRLQRAGSFAQWFIAYRFDDESAMAGVPTPPGRGGFVHLVPPPDRFWADPFPVSWGDRHCIFVEEYLYRERKAHIAVLVLARDGTWTGPVPVLVRPHHLSYPFVFEWRGAHFMCPEARESGAVALYRATAFPYEWTLEGTLLTNVRAVDPTLIELEDRWWMFANLGREGVSDPSCWDDELHLFHARSPLGPWTPHRRNPVKTDLRNSRPAGRLFRWDGGLFRPAQNCSERYGRAITINRIVRIDEDAYGEVPAFEIPPTWAPGLLRTHTINAAPGVTVVDGQLEQRRRLLP